MMVTSLTKVYLKIYSCRLCAGGAVLRGRNGTEKPANFQTHSGTA